MSKKPSLKDIAQRLGVSTALVSYVLNNKKENRIGKEIATRIRQVASELNYQPNRMAQGLKTNRTRTLGLIVADIANPFSAALARAVEDEAEQQGYTVIFGSSDENPAKCSQLIDTLLNRQVDGLLIAPPAGMEAKLTALQQQRTPFVLLDRYYPSLHTSYVALNNYQAMYHAVEHLLSSGYHRIGLVSFDTTLFHMAERGRGYLTALRDHELPTRKSWLKAVDPCNAAIETAKAIRELTTGAHPVDAVVFASNMLTLAGLQQLIRLHVRVPDELAVVGFDETDAYGLFYAPPTYIQQPVSEMSQQATRILLDMLDAPDRIMQVNLPANLIVQASSLPQSAVHG
ncbi:substrate-binding domain-containing protein [uncultured Spirosoma sp.]|uniref:LacI family DNA-binding transcriptional regulator n=1 Tax=uncultured Spirosoma sp. TaxID=278208 RepID=UPI002590873E|nr:substrate-binding domain-containing protein [uncultured Spirosoma sp.]